MSSAYSEVKQVDYNLPKDAKKFQDEFIIFFSDEDDPTVLFHSINPRQAYKEASRIQKKYKKIPTITRVDDIPNNIYHLLWHRV